MKEYLFRYFNLTENYCGTLLQDFLHFKGQCHKIFSWITFYWVPVRSSSLIFIIWVFSHLSVDYTVTSSIKKEEMIDPIYWFVIRVKYLFFRIFQARLRPIWIMDVVGREGWRRGTKDLDDPNMISATVSSTVRWSNNATDRICRTVETGWSAQNIYSQIVAECNRVKGCVWWDTVFVTKQSGTSFKINAFINNAMKNGKECFDMVHTGQRKGEGEQ